MHYLEGWRLQMHYLEGWQLQMHYLEGWRLQMHAAAATLAETATLIAVNEDDLYESDPFADGIDEN